MGIRNDGVEEMVTRCRTGYKSSFILATWINGNKSTTNACSVQEYGWGIRVEERGLDG
jgi:hypothetical protein